jgi:hypothetical protein
MLLPSILQGPLKIVEMVLGVCVPADALVVLPTVWFHVTVVVLFFL